MPLDWQVVLIAAAAVFLRIIVLRSDPDIVHATEEGSSGRSITRNRK